MSSSSNLVNQLTTNSRWSLFPSIMSFHLHRALPHTVFFSSTEGLKKWGVGGETERKPLKIRCCNAPKYRRKKRKKRNKNPKQKEG
jgi:hypothetical protein